MESYMISDIMLIYIFFAIRKYIAEYNTRPTLSIITIVTVAASFMVMRMTVMIIKCLPSNKEMHYIPINLHKILVSSSLG